MITATINDKTIQLERPATVLEAARQLGIHIPTLCNHQVLEAYGGCRLCLVEVEKMPKLQPACMLQIADGMVIRTETDAVVRARRGILELLLINHPLDCPHCDKAGECELQDAVSRYGPTNGRFAESKRKVPESHADPIIARNMERCILCLRCVRMCSGVQGVSALGVMDRGGRSTIQSFSGETFDCEYCGNCVTACPVGSLLSRLSFHNYRPWAIDKNVVTVCGYCGVGCSFVVQTRDNAITRVTPRFGLGLNDGLLCARGRFGYEFRASAERLREPLIKKNGKLETATWDEALELTARRLREIRDGEGGGAIAGIASARCTNEDNYVLQKFLREVCSTDHIDSVSRLGFAAAQSYLESVLREGVTANRIADLRESDAIVVVGGDPTTVNPVLGLSIRAAARKGAKVVVIGWAKGLERFQTLCTTPPVFREPDLLESLAVKAFEAKQTSSHNPNLADRLRDLAGASPRNAGDDVDAISEILLSADSPALVIGMDVVQRRDGHRSLFALAALHELLGAKLYLLSERPNEQGLLDMGCRPETGLTLLETLEAIRKKTVRALVVMGDNPAFNLPGAGAVRESLASLDFLVVQDIFPSETTELADVVLPARAWSEKEGTYTNLERRIQKLRKAVEPPFGMEDWKIVAAIAGKMGHPMAYTSAEDVFSEIAKVSTLYQGLTYTEIERGDCLWPYHDHGRPSTGDRTPPAAPGSRVDFVDSEIYLAIEKPLFHSGTLSRRSKALKTILPEPLLRMSSRRAEALGLEPGDRARVKTERGSFTLRVAVDATVRDNRVFMSNNFAGRGVFELFGLEMDEVTRAPGLDGWPVRIEKDGE